MPLSFRIEGVEGEWTFSAAAASAKDNEFPDRQIEINLFQIVNGNTAQRNHKNSIVRIASGC